MLVEFNISGVGQLLVITLASVAILLHVMLIAMALFELLLRTIQRAAGRG